MKKLIMAMALGAVSVYSYADFPDSNIQEFQGSYTSPSGNANAQKFEFTDIDFGPNPQFSVEKQAGVFFLETPNEMMQIENLPTFIADLEQVEWSGVNLKTNKTSIDLNLFKVTGSAPDNSLVIDNLTLDCQHGTFQGELMLEVLDSCLNKEGVFSLKLMETTKEGRTDKIQDIWFSTKATKMNFKLKAAGATIKGRGATFYEDNSVKIRIDKAKAGFFNVRGKLFKELKKMENENITVNLPWIEIQF
jgi:hypothetical protein